MRKNTKALLLMPLLFLIPTTLVVTATVRATPLEPDQDSQSQTETPESESKESPSESEQKPDITPEEQQREETLEEDASCDDPVCAADSRTLPGNNEPNTPDESCLFDPSQPKCASGENQDCPEGFFQNEDSQCVPSHPNGCPPGYHGHEDDESGRCIPNSTPCDPLYILVSGENDRKNCERKESYCQTHQDDKQCKPSSDDDNKQDHDKQIIIKHIHNTKIIKQITDSNDNLNLKETVVAINYIDGVGINCVIANDDDGQCETFTVTKDAKKTEPLLVVIPFD